MILYGFAITRFRQTLVATAQQITTPVAEDRSVLVTGGAGFIGASVAVGLLARHPKWSLTALDNLSRRGSELNLPRLRRAGVQFVHGDVRVLDDLAAVEQFDAVVECSAEPSVMAGVGESPAYVIGANLVGGYHCLEAARRAGAQVVFLSTSRVYPVSGLVGLTLAERPTRFELADEQPSAGAGPEGVSEDFPLGGARTLYGATKLATELLIEEYRASYGVQAVVDRCGVVAGPWQMGKVDQGVFAYWMLAHHFGRPLAYIGFGGSGKQVRDLLHIDDLVDLIDEQLCAPDHWDGITVNVGGGRAGSLSLLETTELCSEITGRELAIRRSEESRVGDVPVYLSDCTRLYGLTAWRPRRGPKQILRDVHSWILDNEVSVAAAL